MSLDSRRRKVFEAMFCLFCGTQHALVHIDAPNVKHHGPCPGCDEDASVPLRTLVMP